MARREWCFETSLSLYSVHSFSHLVCFSPWAYCKKLTHSLPTYTHNVNKFAGNSCRINTAQIVSILIMCECCEVDSGFDSNSLTRSDKHQKVASARPRLTNTRGRKRKVTSDDSHNNHKTLMLMTDKSGLRHQFTMWFRSATARTLTAHMQVAPPLRSPRMTDSTLSVLSRIEIHWKIPSVAGANGPAYGHRKS